MIYFAFAVCGFGFLHLTATLTGLVTGGNHNEGLTPDDLRDMKPNEGPNEIGEA